MNDKKDSPSQAFPFLGGFVFGIFVLFVILVILSNPISSPQKLQGKQSLPGEPSAVGAGSVISAPEPLPSGEVTRRDRIERGEDYWESYFYIGNQEIASERGDAHGTTEQKGSIPDGPVKFSNDTDSTYGVEYYDHGKREGSSKIYYKDANLMSEAWYRQGKLISKKEYYSNGLLRFEVDYTDARDYKDNKEVGIGKLYFPNGKLKFEWHLTNRESVGFKKSYNSDGTLRAEFYYDVAGNLIKKE